MNPMSCPHFETLFVCLTLQLSDLCHLICVRHVDLSSDEFVVREH